MRLDPRPILGLLFLDCFALYAAQLHAVPEEQMNEAALVVDGASLFHHQHGQQAVGHDKQNRQHRKERAAGLAGRVIARQVPQNGTPIYVPLGQRASLANAACPPLTSKPVRHYREGI